MSAIRMILVYPLQVVLAVLSFVVSMIPVFGFGFMMGQYDRRNQGIKGSYRKKTGKKG